MSGGKTTIYAIDIDGPLLAHAWLIAFMTGVGIMKGSGKLPHKNSRIVGILEFISGALLLPGWAAVQEQTELTETNMYLIGSYMILLALGIVTGDTKKRLSPVCWSQAAIVLYFIHTLQLDTIQLLSQEFEPLYLGPAFFLHGHIFGRFSGTDEKDKVKDN